ncbi:MAG: Gfo/Idh/MocA family protein [Oscillospiraceae bacterium]
MEKVRIALIGAGSIGHYHARAYKADNRVELVAVCDLNEARARDFADKYNIPDIYTDYNVMLLRDDIDAVSVATWNNAHAPASVAAFRAGKHVLCEKPLAMNAEEARQMLEEAEKANKLLMVGFVRRFGDNTAALKALVDAGTLGEIYSAKVGFVRRWGNPGGWFADKKRSGGGALIDLGVHILDLSRYLSGSPKPISAYAATFSKLGMKPGIRGIDKYRTADYDEYCDVEDGATALVRFDNGMVTFVETTWVENAREHLYVTLQGDKGGAEMEPELIIREDRCGYLTDVRPVINLQGINMDTVFGREISHYIDCIQGKVDCICPGGDGLEIMKILDAIYKSAETGHEYIIK